MVRFKGHNILKIEATTQGGRIRGTSLRDAMKTATKGFELLLDHFPIQTRLLSARILLRYGR
jgi:hypothetical protein